MKKEFTETTDQFNERLDKIEGDIKNEREEWQKASNKRGIEAGTIGLVLGILGGLLAR